MKNCLTIDFVRRNKESDNVIFTGLNREAMLCYFAKEIGVVKSEEAAKANIDKIKNVAFVIDTEGDFPTIKEEFGTSYSMDMTNSVPMEIGKDFAKIIIAPNVSFINPFDLALDKLDFEWGYSISNSYNEKVDMIVGFVELLIGHECNAYEVNAIHRACIKMYEPYIEEMKRRHDNGDATTLDTNICPVLSDFCEQLEADQTPESCKIAHALDMYVNGSCDVFNGHTNMSIDLSNPNILDLSYVPERLKGFAVHCCMSYLSNIIKQEKFADKNAWVYMPYEANYFNTNTQLFSLETFYKKNRRYNVFTTLYSSSISELFNTSQGASMLNHTALIGTFSARKEDVFILNDLNDNFNIRENKVLDITK